MSLRTFLLSLLKADKLDFIQEIFDFFRVKSAQIEIQTFPMIGRARQESSSCSLSSQSIDSGFLNFIYEHSDGTPDLDGALDFVSSRAFLSSFSSQAAADFIVSQLISEYPNRVAATNRVLTSLLRSPASPALIRCANQLKDIPKTFFRTFT